ncbi:hypothetical protein [Pseudomonas fluorescens]|uniref:hypothetical protein n=1 Tax=Pseudomonas fluorescens TaxID=294 RepID=UPI001240A07A|nr:hypothetical protein [Pseudomonas fluorescens]
MLLYTKNANNVFDIVDDKFGDRDISAGGMLWRAVYRRFVDEKKPAIGRFVFCSGFAMGVLAIVGTPPGASPLPQVL